MIAVFITTWTPERLAAVLGFVVTLLTSLAGRFVFAERALVIINAALGFIAGPIAVILTSNEALVSWATAKSSFFAWGVSILAYFGGTRKLGIDKAIKTKNNPRVIETTGTRIS